LAANAPGTAKRLHRIVTKAQQQLRLKRMVRC
jgi:hypothetical protein